MRLYRIPKDPPKHRGNRAGMWILRMEMGYTLYERTRWRSRCARGRPWEPQGATLTRSS